MIVESLYEIIRDPLTFYLYSYFFHYRFFVNSVNRILEIGVLILSVIAGVLVGLLRLAPKIINGGVKAVITAVLGIVLTAVYLLTWMVPFAGGRVQRVRSRIIEGWAVSYFQIQAQKLRSILVEVASEGDEPNAEFADPEHYRTELRDVKEDAKTRLENGETALSILLGAVLISAKVAGIRIFEVQVQGAQASLIIEIWLLVIAVSIIYRVAIMDFLAYSPDHEFGSIEEMDTALAYQKAVCLLSIVQGLTLLMVFVYSISGTRSDIVKPVLREVYAEGRDATEWIPMAWRMIREGNEN
ncbi:hypothetical protein [Haloarchaeobius amylolyticus]|uniref:hypothetical protein n=1 Tax=Haloarchaeobius amylolyticus TaxID=1198296 RepID=UPI00226F235A|nr:hypothetical protein [Haloarchaeobius amylolyticus]